MNMHELLELLSERRPVFHSEADFQHALAWEFQLYSRTAEVRLEQQISTEGGRVHLDLLIKDGSRHVAIELKYKSKKASVPWKDEDFHLKGHGAQDLGRYDFLKDIGRIERYVETRPGSEGYAVLLTNDSTYWQESRKVGAIDASFRLHEGRAISGDLAWGKAASKGTMRAREAVIRIGGKYTMKWHNFSQIGEQSFRYAAVHVPCLSG